VHSAVERFLTDYPGELPADALRRLCAYGDEELVAAGASPAVLSLWRPRFARAARWLLAYERERRTTIARALVEQSAELKIATPNGEITLRGRADRIDLMPDGSVQIIDYKTGRAPTQKQIDVLLSPQLPLEGAMAMQGAFSGTVGAPISALVHIRLTGGVPPGEECSFDGDCTGKSLEALERLTRRVMRYDDPAQPYRSRERIERISDTGDYDHLARVREWSLIERPEL
jgi:ATP-dependent helicase/nuclease subunit B